MDLFLSVFVVNPRRVVSCQTDYDDGAFDAQPSTLSNTVAKSFFPLFHAATTWFYWAYIQGFIFSLACFAQHGRYTGVLVCFFFFSTSIHDTHGIYHYYCVRVWLTHYMRFYC